MDFCRQIPGGKGGVHSELQIPILAEGIMWGIYEDFENKHQFYRKI